MSVLTADDNRVLAPAWFKSEDAVYSAELKSLKPITKSFKDISNLNDLYKQFSLEPNFSLAVELLSMSYVENKIDIAKEMARYIITHQHVVPQALLGFCQSLIGQNNGSSFEDTSVEKEIKRKKIWLRDNPKDCVSWVDLSRLYMSIGLNEQAEKAILVGLGLSNGNRWVARVASRFFFNLDEYDRAHYILIKHPNIQNDPWLLASELAISDANGRKSRYWTNAKKILKSGYPIYHTTELQSSIGTLELQSGAIRKARAYFDASLVKPNGNILAQAKWAERKGNIKNLVQKETLIKMDRAAEAKYQDAYYSQNMLDALHYAKLWLDEEPFNPQPAICGSYIASLLDDYEQCNEISKRGLMINPNDDTLRLNEVFSSISLTAMLGQDISDEQISRSIIVLADIVKSDDEDSYPHALANFGLLYYKTGSLEKGREYYELAAEGFKKINHPGYVLSELNHLREALISNSPWKNELFDRIESASKTGGHWKEPCVSFYLRKLQLIRFSSEGWQEKLTSELSNESFKKDEEFVMKFSSERFDFSKDNPTIWIPNKKT